MDYTGPPIISNPNRNVPDVLANPDDPDSLPVPGTRPNNPGNGNPIPNDNGNGNGNGPNNNNGNGNGPPVAPSLP